MKLLTAVLLAACSYSLYSQEDTTQYGTKRFTLHMQETTVSQFRQSFSAPYTGDHSQATSQEWATTITSSIYAGMRLWRYAEAYVNPEIAGGSGLSSAFGIAAFTNGEAFRVGSPKPTIYLARGFFRQVIPLSKEREQREDGENRILQKFPVNYLSFTVGKVSIADYFDDNTFSHNPRTQFLSWGLMSNGAWDYPANTRGYTPSIILEYIGKRWEARYGLSMMPTTANGNTMDGNITKANASTFELKYKYELKGYAGKVSALAFYNTAFLGSYSALNMISVVDSSSPGFHRNEYDISGSGQYGRSKYGFGINIEQYLGADLGVFARASYNDGKNETWCFTEIDRAFSIGASLRGKRWKRKEDVVGLAYCISGLSNEHAAYLAKGGLGFIIGDGRLNYSNEHLIEAYYSMSLLKEQINASLSYQFIMNPAYNKDRGPINVYSIRLHFSI